MIVSGEVPGPQKHPTDHAAAVFEVHGNQLLPLFLIKRYHKLSSTSRILLLKTVNGVISKICPCPMGADVHGLSSLFFSPEKKNPMGSVFTFSI